MELWGRCVGEGISEGLPRRAEGEKRDGIAGMGGVAEGAEDIVDVPWRGTACYTEGGSDPLQWPSGELGGQGVPLMALPEQS